MMPFVGLNYRKSDPKFLLIGESFYLPDSCTLNDQSDVWYASEQTKLMAEEQKWRDCRGLIACGWESPGHYIYRELNSSISEVLENGFADVAYMNAFQRPACEEGDSIRKDCTAQDIEMASKTIDEVQAILKPDVIIFVAKFSWDVLEKSFHKEPQIQYDFVCDPGTGGRYWHDKDYPHGKSKFIEILELATKNRAKS